MSYAKLIITAIEDTLYNWTNCYALSMRGALHYIAKETNVNEDELIKELQQIFQKHQSIEYPYWIQKLSVCKNMKKSELEHFKTTAIKVFGIVRGYHLIPYDGVSETLGWASSHGVAIVGLSRAAQGKTYDRLADLKIIKNFSGVVTPSFVWERVIKRENKSCKKNWRINHLAIEERDMVYKMLLDYYNLPPKNVFVISNRFANDVIPALKMGINGIWARYECSLEGANIDTIRQLNPKLRAESELVPLDPPVIIDSFEMLKQIISPPQMDLPGF